MPVYVPSRRGHHSNSGTCTASAQYTLRFSPLREGDTIVTLVACSPAIALHPSFSPLREGDTIVTQLVYLLLRQDDCAFQSPSRRGHHSNTCQPGCMALPCARFSPLREGD